MVNMQWEHILALVIGNGALIIPLFLWNRAESRSDIRHMDTLLRAIQEEIKDFHGRLCKIESERKG
jgi:hypothetical protein